MRVIVCYLNHVPLCARRSGLERSQRKVLPMIRKAVVALAATMLWGGTAFAQSSPAPSFWNDAWGPRSSTQQSVDLYTAEAQLRARNGGYGPGQSTTNYNGTVNSYSTYNGPVSSSGATNIVNSNSTSSTVSGSSNVTLSVTTGQTSGSSTQGATSGSYTVGGSTGDITNSTGRPN